ncbi:MAG TPA: DUF6458 family protein [Streptosporangiaceae bacterium]|jgi:hypothetical protein|nr:DUF6458 family protein [Streptosporangiaceae bacterium]
MTIGGSIGLIILGAIFRFAINWSPALVNLRLVGVILMIGGAVALIISVSLLASRRRGRAVDTAPAEVVEERRYMER